VPGRLRSVILTWLRGGVWGRSLGQPSCAVCARRGSVAYPAAVIMVLG